MNRIEEIQKLLLLNQGDRPRLLDELEQLCLEASEDAQARMDYQQAIIYLDMIWIIVGRRDYIPSMISALEAHVPIGRKPSILVCTRPSMLFFVSNSLKPMLIQSSISWPALTRWNIDYILTACGHRLVPVEIGKRYIDSDWTQQLMTVSEYFDRFVFAELVGYIAQHDLVGQVEKLQADIYEPEYCSAPLPDSADAPIRQVWLGKAGTESPLHQDPYYNIFVQVVGSKVFDIENPHDPLDRSRIIINPGEILYLPRFWWHRVESISFSVSVSYWF